MVQEEVDIDCWYAAAGKAGKLHNSGGIDADGPVQRDIPDGNYCITRSA